MKNYLINNFDPIKLLDVFDELPLWSAPFGLQLLDRIIYKKNITALDIGFGAGFPLTELAMRLGSTSKVYGIDPWKAAADRAKMKIAYYGIDNVELIDGIAEKIPLPDASIDLITSNNGINNVSDINAVYGECSRILKSGGQFIQTMNSDKSMIEFYYILEEILSEMKLTENIARLKQHIYDKRKPINEIKQMMDNRGFHINSIVEDQFQYIFSDGTAMLNHYFMRLAFMDSWIKIIPEEYAESIFDEAEKRMNAIAEKNGDFRLSIPYYLVNAFRN